MRCQLACVPLQEIEISREAARRTADFGLPLRRLYSDSLPLDAEIDHEEDVVSGDG